MSDERLRQLERKWRETGAVDDETALLVERMRVGNLARERLDIAAYCGNEAARRVSGGADAGTDGAEWVLGLERFGVQHVVRALAFAAEEVLPIFEAEHESDLPRRTVQAVHAWCDCPCQEHFAAVMGDRGLGDMAGGTGTAWGPTDAVNQAAWAADHAAAGVWMVEHFSQPGATGGQPLGRLRQAASWLVEQFSESGPKHLRAKLIRPVDCVFKSLEFCGLPQDRATACMRSRLMQWALRST